MFVVRYTWQFQDATFAKARKLFTGVQPPETNLLRGARDYEAVTGVNNTLALEWEFDNLQDWEKFSAMFFADPKIAKQLSEWPDAEISTTEIWKITARG
jgi:hypothetical protein